MAMRMRTTTTRVAKTSRICLSYEFLRMALVSLLALLLIWRVLASNVAALLEVGDAGNFTLSRTSDVIWREKIAADPTDMSALLVLGLALERDGKHAEAGEAMRQEVHLAPADR